MTQAAQPDKLDEQLCMFACVMGWGFFGVWAALGGK